MLFLIDYENVGNAGMKGYGYLDMQDHVVIFYSEAKKHMERRILEELTSSKCIFEVCKLCKTGRMPWIFILHPGLGS